jgi:hypothetical protein
LLKVTASEKLVEIIKEIQPDLVHSLEMQSQTYHVLRARRKIEFNWAYFSWGSDIYLYQNQKKHREKMIAVFSKLNYYFVDNKRDIQLAKELGFEKPVTGIFPGGGGYHLEKYKEYIKPVAERSLILIKGYDHWAGRALQVLNALEFILDDIKNHDIYVFSAHDVVVEKIKELKQNHKLNIDYSSRFKEISHEELLKKFGMAKIAIGNSISDGIPNTLLEAIILGAFPIQSNPGGVSEDYISSGENGFLINDPESAKEISNYILKALNSEELLVEAFNINQDKSKALAYNVIQSKVLETYSKIAKKNEKDSFYSK